MIFDLSRFISAQTYDYDRALTEIRSGRKRSHWMWYIFPQLRSLGRSDTARLYGISGLEEAKAYMADPVLGPRLIQISEALLTLETNDPHSVFGSPDDMKLRSCMTLFACAAPDEPVFRQVLNKFYGGQGDPLTLAVFRKA